MHLDTLLQSLDLSSDIRGQVTGLQVDSRLVLPGNIFIAVPGASCDGREHIVEALDAGAIMVLYEPNGCNIHHDLSARCVQVANLADRVSILACAFYGDPSRGLSVVGVTGTNGKTTIAHQLAQANILLNKSAAYIGTLGLGDVYALQPSTNTTPGALCMQRTLSECYQQGIEQVCMEVSSHGLAEKRVSNIAFEQAIYTNLTHDHLDYHGTMANYAAAKKDLFKTKSLKSAIINVDDAYAQQMISAVPSGCQVITYGLHPGADVYAKNIKYGISGTSFDVVSLFGDAHLSTTGLGQFNIYNALAVFSSLLAQGNNFNAVSDVMSRLKSCPGRMEVVLHSPVVVVDYAHTPDALENVLQTLTKFKVAESSSKLWVVFGCGGDRDRTKRPIMGMIASKYADMVVITSDNPRKESPESIINAIAAGVTDESKVMKILDRAQAIREVLSLANANDIILIAGKGHESYQEIGTERIFFSDQAIVRADVKINA